MPSESECCTSCSNMRFRVEMVAKLLSCRKQRRIQHSFIHFHQTTFISSIYYTKTSCITLVKTTYIQPIKLDPSSKFESTHHAVHSVGHNWVATVTSITCQRFAPNHKNRQIPLRARWNTFLYQSMFTIPLFDIGPLLTM
jgi:hypothetical protein